MRATPWGYTVLRSACRQLLPPSVCGIRGGRIRFHQTLAAPTEAGGGLAFETADGAAAPLFPELLQPGARCVVLGVDPDISGAVAVLRWQNGSGEGGGGVMPPVESMDLIIHDMPVEVWQLGSRDKRQPSAAALLGLLREHALAPAEGGAVVRALVEYTTPQHLSGKHAWYGIGFSIGLLHGLLEAQGVSYRRVPASLWKRQMGLVKLGKEGSLALAKHLLPASAHHLKRKKDHGRAEAMLLAAWGLGTRAEVIASSLPPTVLSAEDTEEEEEEVDEWKAAFTELEGWRADNPSAAWPVAPATLVGLWIKGQRQQYKAMVAGNAKRAGGMTATRAAQLEGLPDWEWASRRGGGSSSSSRGSSRGSPEVEGAKATDPSSPEMPG